METYFLLPKLPPQVLFHIFLKLFRSRDQRRRALITFLSEKLLKELSGLLPAFSTTSAGGEKR